MTQKQYNCFFVLKKFLKQKNNLGYTKAVDQSPTILFKNYSTKNISWKFTKIFFVKPI